MKKSDNDFNEDENDNQYGEHILADYVDLVLVDRSNVAHDGELFID